MCQTAEVIGKISLHEVKFIGKSKKAEGPERGSWILSAKQSSYKLSGLSVIYFKTEQTPMVEL